MRFATIPIHDLPIGSTLGAPVHDARQIKLLSAGVQITESLLESLRQRSVHTVAISVADFGRIKAFKPQGKSRQAHPERQALDVRLHTDHSRVLDTVSERLANEDNLQIAPSANPFAAATTKPGCVSYDRDFTQEMLKSHESTIDQLDSAMQACKNGDTSELEMIERAVQDALKDTSEDQDAVACLGANPSGYSYPGRHAKHFSMLATSMGVTLGLNESTLHELGVGCLIHDVGMMALDRRMFESRKVLEADEFMEIAKHPIKTFDIISEHLDKVPLNARMVAFQTHERFNGEGYPRRRAGGSIHPLARIAAVADTYTALVSPRPHRPGMLPYFAMEKMVRDTSRGLFDPKAMRSLLETVGLFPLGSYVELSHDFVGRVIRANGKNYTQPIVEVWKRPHLSNRPAIIDLSIDTRLKVIKPLASLVD